MAEEWRDVDGYEGFYEVSNLGSVRSLDRVVASKSGHRIARGKTLAASRGKTGRYLMVVLAKEGQKKTALVHRLVCAAFHGTPENGMHAAHVDGDVLNNSADNLYWATPKQNCADRVRHNTWAHGTKVNTNKLSEKQVSNIVAMCRQGFPRKVVANIHGVHRSSVDQMMRGDTWKHMGIA